MPSIGSTMTIHATSRRARAARQHDSAAWKAFGDEHAPASADAMVRRSRRPARPRRRGRWRRSCRPRRRARCRTARPPRRVRTTATTSARMRRCSARIGSSRGCVVTGCASVAYQVMRAAGGLAARRPSPRARCRSGSCRRRSPGPARYFSRFGCRSGGWNSMWKWNPRTSSPSSAPGAAPSRTGNGILHRLSKRMTTSRSTAARSRALARRRARRASRALRVGAT